jgi:hypothetical protein
VGNDAAKMPTDSSNIDVMPEGILSPMRCSEVYNDPCSRNLHVGSGVEATLSTNNKRMRHMMQALHRSYQQPMIARNAEYSRPAHHKGEADKPFLGAVDLQAPHNGQR